MGDEYIMSVIAISGTSMTWGANIVRIPLFAEQEALLSNMLGWCHNLHTFLCE